MMSTWLVYNTETFRFRVVFAAKDEDDALAQVAGPTAGGDGYVFWEMPANGSGVVDLTEELGIAEGRETSHE